MAGKGAKPGERRGGRAKGTPNKRSLEAQEVFRRHRCNPLIRLIQMLDDQAVIDDPALKISILKELVQYAFPKRKPVDAEGSSVEHVQIGVETIDYYDTIAEITGRPRSDFDASGNGKGSVNGSKMG